MNSEAAIAAVIDALAALSIPQLVVGSLSSNYYGIPRSTQDADFVVQTKAAEIPLIAKQLGPGFHLDPQISFETVTATTRYVLHLVDEPFTIELFLLSDDLHDQERFRRRCPATILGRNTFVPTPEDVMITKLRWSLQGRRAKDLDDIRGVIAVQGNRIDWEYVNRWCESHGTRDVLERIRNSIAHL